MVPVWAQLEYLRDFHPLWFRATLKAAVAIIASWRQASELQGSRPAHAWLLPLWPERTRRTARPQPVRHIEAESWKVLSNSQNSQKHEVP